MTEQALRFLIVDDDVFLRRSVKNMLQMMNIVDVYEAADGVQALDILKQDHMPSIDIILCDLNMPGMDGMEFLRHLGASGCKASIAVVSSHDHSLLSAVSKMGAAYGVNIMSALKKPLSLVKLEELVRQYQSLRGKVPSHRPARRDYTLSEILDGVRDDQFEPFFQPKLNIITGEICGAEALARWRLSTGEVVPPGAFIDQLEKSGNILEMTFQILQKSLVAIRRLKEQGHMMPVAVNLSTELLTDISIANRIIQFVQDSGIDPGQLILEITETGAIRDVGHTLENLTRLKMHGFGLSIDDYGTGFSNIQQVQRVAFDELKIDQSFVSHCFDDEGAYVIVKTSVDMAHKLNMKCVAEGIESQSDWNAIKSAGCDMVQGYFISKPIDIESFGRFCSAHSPRAFL